MTELNQELYDSKLPEMPEPAAEPETQEVWQNFRLGVKAGSVGKKDGPEKPGLIITANSETFPGTAPVYKRIEAPTAETIAVATDPTGQEGPKRGLEPKEVRIIRMRYSEWKNLQRITGYPDGLSLSEIAAALDDQVHEFKARKGKDYVDRDGNDRKGQMELDLLARKKA